MSGLFASLNASVSALSAQSRAVEIAGKNLANVNNPNYARQRVVFGDRGTVVTPQGVESLGLEALGVQQLRDALLDRQVSRESSLTAYYTAQQSAFQRAQAGLGQDVSSASDTAGTSSTSTDTGIGAALDGLFNSFQSFAANPTDSGQRQSLLQSTSILTDRIQQADQNLSQVQTDLDTQVSTDVDTTNGLLKTIADLNAQIGRFEVDHPGSAVDLRDQRQAALEQLAAKLPVTVTEDSTGEVQVSSKDGSGSPVVLVDRSDVKGTVAYDTSTTPPTVTAGSPATVLSLISGSIEGSLSARIGEIQTLRNQLDQFAQQLVTSVNAAYNPSGTTGDFFDASGTTAGTIHIASTVTAANLKASDGGAAGDNTVALAIAQLATKKFSTTGTPADLIDGTFSGFFANAVSGLGGALAAANASVTNQTNIETLVRSQRDAVSGVSLDEEMSDLTKYQRAFQASSRVFTTIDNLLDVVINELGH